MTNIRHPLRFSTIKNPVLHCVREIPGDNSMEMILMMVYTSHLYVDNRLGVMICTGDVVTPTMYIVVHCSELSIVQKY